MADRDLIAEGRKHDVAMTDAPWTVADPGWHVHAPSYPDREVVATQFASDADGIAWMRTNLSALLDAVDTTHTSGRNSAAADMILVCTERDDLKRQLDEAQLQSTRLIYDKVSLEHRLRRLYNAMCSAMANWLPPEPDDASVSDNAWVRENQAKQDAYAEMKAVFDASPGVLYVDGKTRPTEDPVAALRAEITRLRSDLSTATLSRSLSDARAAGARTLIGKRDDLMLRVWKKLGGVGEQTPTAVAERLGEVVDAVHAVLASKVTGAEVEALRKLLEGDG